MLTENHLREPQRVVFDAECRQNSVGRTLDGWLGFSAPPLAPQNCVNQTALLVLSRLYLSLFKERLLRPPDTYSSGNLEPAAIQNL